MKNIISTDHTGVTAIIAHHEAAGARPASLKLSCPVKLNKFARQTPEEKADKKAKVACPFAHVVKHSESSVIVNFDYEGNVNRQREREGKEADFTTQANWFEHITRAIVKHRTTGERYIFVRVLSSLSTAYFTAGEADAPVIERASLVPYLPADDLTDIERAQAGLGLAVGSVKQDLDKEITPITFKLANVRQIVIDGFTYIITPDATTVTPESISSTKPAALVTA